MEVLIAHREKLKRMQAGMNTLTALHDRLLETWRKIIELRDSLEIEGRVERIGQLHQAAKEIAADIIEERKALFGSIASLSELDISSRVDSLVLQKQEQEAANLAVPADPVTQAA